MDVGYDVRILGYKNARFGKIEAHESVNAFAREGYFVRRKLRKIEDFRLFMELSIVCG